MIANALKTIDRTQEELRVGNYLILFGGSDLEGEHFTPQTDFESSYTKSGVLYVDWEHGKGEELDGKGSPGREDVLGYVDWGTRKIDELGVWVQRVLDRSSKYAKYLETLIDAGVIGNSTEAIASDVVKTASGEIQKWPLKRDTLTVQPMEPRMVTENLVVALKGLQHSFPHLKFIMPAADEETSEQLLARAKLMVALDEPEPETEKSLHESVRAALTELGHL